MHILIISAWLFAADPAPNWPQFRGPTGDGVAQGKVATAWSETENVRWKTAIHDKGWSSPVVRGDQIWLTTAKENGREFFAICIDRRSGRILHDVSLFTEEKPAFCHPFNSYASPTPVVEEGRVYCHFGSHGTVCLDTATGKPLWTNRELKCDHYRGPGSSPIIYKDYLILTFDGFDAQYTCALDKYNGKVIWKQDHNIKYSTTNADYHKAYGTPSIIIIDGKPQLVTPSAGSTIARDPASGKELWRVSTGGMNQALRPIHANDLIYLSCGHDSAIVAVRPVTAEIAWRAKDGPTRPGILVLDEHLFMVSDKGSLSCLNAKTGKVIWNERLDGAFTASPVAAGNVMVFPNEQGKTFVIDAAAEYKLLGVSKLADGCMASPALAGDDLIVRTKTHLYCIGK